MNQEINDSSLKELQEEADQAECNEKSAIKAMYLLGIVYLNGNSSLEVDRDFDKSLHYLKEAWKYDVADAGLPLASMYYFGDALERDYPKALKYLQDSANLGYLESQRELGKAYLGREWVGMVPKDVEKAISWLEKAANGGDLHSANILANIYYIGDVVDKNYQTSLQWLIKSSESKYGVDVTAFPSLAEFYEKGIGAEVNFITAYKYYDLSGTSGEQGKVRLSGEMTQEQIDEAIRLSREWQEKHNTFVPSYDGLEHQPDGSYR